MTSNRTSKKPARQDWTPAYICYRVWDSGATLRKLDRAHGFAPGALSVALRRAWPNAQRIIAEAIGVAPQEIWPSRYEPDGRPKKGLRSKFRSPARPPSHSIGSVGNDPEPGNGNIGGAVKQKEAA